MFLSEAVSVAPQQKSLCSSSCLLCFFQAVYVNCKILFSAWECWAAGVSNYQVSDPITEEHRLDTCPLKYRSPAERLQCAFFDKVLLVAHCQFEKVKTIQRVLSMGLGELDTSSNFQKQLSQKERISQVVFGITDQLLQACYLKILRSSCLVSPSARFGD